VLQERIRSPHQIATVTLVTILVKPRHDDRTSLNRYFGWMTDVNRNRDNSGIEIDRQFSKIARDRIGNLSQYSKSFNLETKIDFSKPKLP
jgi:hypothetical protein